MEMNLGMFQGQMMINPNPGDMDRYLIRKYNQAQNKAWYFRLIARLFGRPNSMIMLDRLLTGKAVEISHYAGLQSISIDQILGSEARSTDFDRDFNPLSARNMARWLSVARARLTGVPLPPVELIKLGDTYFVRDGHHRISVARTMGEHYIEAEVTVWDIAR